MSLRMGRPRTRGQALVEFALLLPVLVTLLFGILDLGRAVYAYNTIGNAARVGARVAAVNQLVSSTECNEARPIEDPADPHWTARTCAAASAISLGVRPEDVTVTYSPPPSLPSLGCPNSPSVTNPLHVGCLATVHVTYQWSPFTPVISAMFSSITMDSTSQASIERVFP